jgi:four helix bundle protein
MFRFEKLDVWQRSIAFAELIYKATRSFPSEERFGLTNQMRRAAVSVSSNIAEGSGRVSGVDYARFLEIAYASLMEVVSQAALAKRQGLMTPNDYSAVYNEAEELARMLSGLRSTLLKDRGKALALDSCL